MWSRILVALGFMLAIGILPPAHAQAAPYVACLDGHIAVSLEQCPTPKKSDGDDPPIGGGPRRSGLLGLGIGGIL